MEEIEPSGLGHDLLMEWAEFARDDTDGRASWSVKPRVDPGHGGTPPDRWFDINRIVSGFCMQDSSFRSVVKRFYLGEMPYWLIAKDLKRPEISIRSSLCWACEQVRREWLDLKGK